MTTSTLLIGGRWQAADEIIERFDPAALERLTGRFAAATEAHVTACCSRSARPTRAPSRTCRSAASRARAA